MGNDGILRVPMVFGGALAGRAICSVAGSAQRMDSSTFLVEVERDGPLRELVGDYLQALFGQISRAAACNRLHSADQRRRSVTADEPRPRRHRPVRYHPRVPWPGARFPPGHRDPVCRDPAGGRSHRVRPAAGSPSSTAPASRRWRASGTESSRPELEGRPENAAPCRGERSTGDLTAPRPPIESIAAYAATTAASVTASEVLQIDSVSR